MNLLILLALAPFATNAQKYANRDIRGKLLDDTLTVSSRLYPQKVQPTDVAKGNLNRYVRQKPREIHVTHDGVVHGDFREHDSTKNFPVTATFSVGDNNHHQRHKGIVLDDRNYPNSRKYSGHLLDDYVSSVTESDINSSTTEKDLIEILRHDEEKEFGKAKTKYIADFSSAFEIPEDKLPPSLKESTTSYPNKDNKKRGKKKTVKPLYLSDQRLKDITLNHEKAIDDLNAFASKLKGVETKEKPVYELHPFGKPQVPFVTFSPLFTTKPSTTTKKTYSGFQPITNLPSGAVANRNRPKKVNVRFADTPEASRLNQFLKNSEDERLEQAVRKALASLRKTRGSPIGSASHNRPISSTRDSPNRPPGPPRRPRPFNRGPSPSRTVLQWTH